jgi:Tol biopolymer transport system component
MLMNHLHRTGGFRIAAAPLALLALALAAPAQSPPGERAVGLIGYTARRTDLPGGYGANTVTARGFVVHGDGSGTKELAPELIRKPNQYSQFARWSPDGRQAILYQGWESPENGAWEYEHRAWRITPEHWLVDVILFDMKSRRATNLTAVERVSCYNTGLQFWPGKADQFGFLARIDGEDRPYRMDRDGRHKEPLAAGPGFIYGFCTSPDGKRICYHKNYRLYLADADGGNARPIADEHPFHFLPAWSPSGEWLAYLSGEHYNCHPYLVRPDGTGLRKLADRGGFRGVIETLDKPAFNSERSDIPLWSPDGRWLYFAAKVGEAVELMRASPAGRVEQLTHSKSGVQNYFAQVSPDSKWVAFGSTRSGVRQLYVAHADGSGAYPITKLEAGWGAFYPHWRPE